MLAIFIVDDSFANPTIGQDPDGIGPATNFGTDSFATIQAAINASSPTGDTVLVNAGTYNELVAVNKSVTLRGAQFGVDARTRGVVPESIISNGDGDIQILADNVTVDGFTLTGVVNDPSMAPFTGLGAAVWTNPGFSGTQGGHQILNNIINGNISGVELDNTGTFATKVQYNLIQNNTAAGAGSGNGLQVNFGLANAVIDNNTFINNPNGSASIFVGGASIDVTNNSADGQFYLASATSGNITGNTITSSSNGGIVLGGNSGLTISNNEVNGVAAGFSAFRLRDDGPGPNSDITVTNNKFVGGAGAYGVRPGPGSYTGILTLSSNQISGGLAAIENDDAALMINASSNYFGSSVPATVSTTILGAGTANVDFTPLLNNDESVANQLIVGFTPDFTSLTVHTLGLQTGGGRIEEGLGLVTTGGLVNVAAGTYTLTGDVGINSGVTLRGPNSAISPNNGSRGSEAVINGGDTLRIRISTTDPVSLEGLQLSHLMLDSYTADSQITYQKNIIDHLPGNIFLNAPATWTLSDNHIYGTADDWDDALIAGDWNGTTGTMVSIQNNVIENSSIMSTASGLNLTNVAGTISGNTFQDKAFYGVLLANNSAVTISGNTFDNIYNPNPVSFASNGGIRFYTPGIVNVSITSNLFENSYNGIAVRQGSITAGATIDITSNTFTNNTYDIINLGNGGLTPSGNTIFDGVTLSSATTSQLYAIADKVVDAVDVSAVGLVDLKTGNIYVTPNSFFANALSPVIATTVANIQRAVDAATSGDTIHIQSGSYTGNVNAATPSKNVTLSPGASPGQVTITGDLTLNAGDTLAIEINGTSAATQYDNFVVSGNVALGGATLNRTLGFVPLASDVFHVITSGSLNPVSGTFDSLPQAAKFLLGGKTFYVYYNGVFAGDGNDVTLQVNVVPTTSGISNVTVAEDAANSVIGLFPSFADQEDPDPALTYTIIGNTNPILFSSLSINGSNGQLTLDYAADINSVTNGGSSTITVRATDTDGDFVETSFTVTVTEVNDAPTGTNDALSAIAEDSGNRTISFASLLGNDSIGPGNESGQVLTISAMGPAVGGSVSIVGTDVIFSPTLNFNGAASFVYTLRDNGTTASVNDFKTATATASFTITEVNDAPNAVTDVVPFYIGPGTRTITQASLLANDTPGPANESSQTLTFGTVGSPLPSGATAVVSGSDVLYTPPLGYSGPASFTYTVTDNGTTNGSPDPLASTGMASLFFLFPGVALPAIDLNGPLANFSNTVTYTENTPAVVLPTNTATVTDSDSTYLLSVTATLLSTPDGVSEVLSAVTTGTSITASYNPATRVLTLMGPDSAVNFQQVLRTVAYQNTSEAPTVTPARTVRFVASDGANLSVDRDATINLVAVNDPPSTAGTTTPLGYTENGSPLVAFPDLTANDPDSLYYFSGGYSAGLIRATVSISPYIANQDRLNYTNVGIGGTFNTTTGVFTLNGTATLAQYNNALRLVTYQNLSDAPDTTPRNITLTVFDSTTSSTPLSRTVNVTSVNDAPIADLNGPSGTGINYSTTYRTSIGTIPIAYSTSTVTDLDNATMTSLTVTITNVQNIGNEVLTFTLPGGIIASAPSNTASTVVFTGTASPATYQTLLRSIQYRNLAGSPTLSPARIVTFAANDGTGTPTAIGTSTTTVTLTSPLIAEGSPTKYSSRQVTRAELSSIVDAAITRWGDIGLTDKQLALLRNTSYVIADFATPGLLGTAASGQVITLDDNAAGFGWFVDTTPLDDKEFPSEVSHSERRNPGMTQMDLLTVVMHEMGHILGLPDIDEHGSSGVMTDALTSGTRRMCSADDMAMLAFYLAQNSSSSNTASYDANAIRAEVFARWN